MNDLRDMFNERRWVNADLSTLLICARHRGAPNDEREISGALIEHIRPGGLVFQSSDPEEGEDPTWFLPWHRVLRVTAPEGTLWERPRSSNP